MTERFRAFWPIELPNMAPTLLIAEAEADLPAVARQAGIKAADLTDLRWSIEGGHVCLLADVTPGRKERRNKGTHRCSGCGCRTKAQGGKCRACKEYEECAPVERWVRHGLIWRAA